MNQDLSPLLPDLQFVSELTPDLKIRYFELFEEAYKELKKFSQSLNDIYVKHKNMLLKNIQLSITNETLENVIRNKDLDEMINESKSPFQKPQNNPQIIKNENNLSQETYCSDYEIDFKN